MTCAGCPPPGSRSSPGEVAGLVVTDDRLTGIRLSDGTVHAREILYAAPRPRPRNDLLITLGAELRARPRSAATR